MFKKILIANRGEIACRVIKTARKMGISTVAVYSDADRNALHVRMADEAVHIGPPPAAESYIVIDKIMDAIRQTGAEAVHPGYGFLSENKKFAEALEAEGVAFIGPPAGAIEAMGDKITSKKIAADAGVSTVPGHMGLIEDAEEAIKISGEIGYPVMLKASAGGGGKGMRIAWSQDEVREGFQASKNEAASSFGDDRMFIEKFVTQPRHIEIQVLADGHGNAVYLGERECSIQRRNQKVIEEAPSPFLDETLRNAMGAQAVALAEAVGYRSAGTVEFIADAERNFYFLEMNTRVQVEHPVTEMITGLDIVEWMIRIAAGDPLDFTQEEVRFDGWSLESRIYAEDPLRHFMPSVGRLSHYREPLAPPAETGLSLRVDSGVIEGSEISLFYDPMIAKLVSHGPTRAAATEAMMAALDAFYIRGVSHNIDFLTAVLANERFREGRLTTNFIAEEFPDGFHGRSLPEATVDRLVAVAALLQRIQAERESTIDGQLEGHQVIPSARWVVSTGGRFHPREILLLEGGYRVDGPDTSPARFVEVAWQPGEALFTAMLDDRPITVQVDRAGPRWRLSHGGAALDALVLTPRAAELAAKMPEKAPPDLSKYLLSPMPGLLVSLSAEVGQEVKAGEELAVVEAMKMENVLRAERDAVVTKVHANPGESLAVDQAILEFE